MRIFFKIIFIFFVLLVYPSVAQTWFRHYGGMLYDGANSIQQTSDGGYVVVGHTDSYTYGSDDFSIYKLDSDGNKVWFKHYGGLNDDYAMSIQQTSDGNYIVAGYTYSYTHGHRDFAIYKLNSNGDKLWFKHYGGSDSDRGYSIQQTSDGGYIVAGATKSFTHGNYDFAIYRLNGSGNKIWFKHYGGINDDLACSVLQASDSGYVIAGYSESFTYGDKDFAIYKLNASGNKVWFNHYGGTDDDYAYSIQQTSEGGYIVAGFSESFTHGDRDFALYKLNVNGEKVWFKHYGGINEDVCYEIQQTSEGGYIVAGTSNSFSHGSFDFSIYKLNGSGNKVWFKYYGGTNSDQANSCQQTSDGGYVVAGYTYSFTHGNNDFAIYKLDSDGDK